MKAAPKLIIAALAMLPLSCATHTQPTHSPKTPDWLRVQQDATAVAAETASAEARQKRALLSLEPGRYTLHLNTQASAGQTPATPITLFRKVPLTANEATSFQLEIKEAGRYQIILNEGPDAHFRVTKAPAEAAKPTAGPVMPGSTTNLCTAVYDPLTVTVAPTFKDGEWVRDFYSGQSAQVLGGKITLKPAPDSEGLLLLEPKESSQQFFTWDNATVYFVITDRFANGRTDNDQSYGRRKDGKQEIGTFHGGDFAGLTKKLDYLKSLGVNALWLSPPFEQIHGWVGGGDRGDFKHYGYHGYYSQDFTRLDANMGTEEELRGLIREAHDRGIRVLFDVVMNHPGYGTLQDMQNLGFGGLREGFEKHMPAQWGDWQPESHENFHAYHAMIDYDHAGWAHWWSKDWVRAGIHDYDSPPNAMMNEQQGSLAFLPDFKTESTKPVDLPRFLKHKADTRAQTLPNASVRDYLVTWLTQWVWEYGIDGFRVDTVKHVEPESWIELKKAAQQALLDYRKAHPDEPALSDDFWMVGEVFPHGVTKSHYFQSGFDAVINFDYQKDHAKDGAKCLNKMDAVFEKYAHALNEDPDFNVLSYISSHDTRLFSSMTQREQLLQKRAASAFLLLPGAVQIYYGDESDRPFGASGSDPMQGTRSDMNWVQIESGEVAPVLDHWRKLGQFRDRHPAIGGGLHRKISASPYTFARTRGEDRVVIAVGEQLGN